MLASAPSSSVPSLFNFNNFNFRFVTFFVILFCTLLFFLNLILNLAKLARWDSDSQDHLTVTATLSLKYLMDFISFEN